MPLSFIAHGEQPFALRFVCWSTGAVLWRVGSLQGYHHKYYYVLCVSLLPTLAIPRDALTKISESVQRQYPFSSPFPVPIHFDFSHDIHKMGLRTYPPAGDASDLHLTDGYSATDRHVLINVHISHIFRYVFQEEILTPRRDRD